MASPTHISWLLAYFAITLIFEATQAGFAEKYLSFSSSPPKPIPGLSGLSIKCSLPSKSDNYNSVSQIVVKKYSSSKQGYEDLAQIKIDNPKNQAESLKQDIVARGKLDGMTRPHLEIEWENASETDAGTYECQATVTDLNGDMMLKAAIEVETSEPDIFSLLKEVVELKHARSEQEMEILRLKTIRRAQVEEIEKLKVSQREEEEEFKENITALRRQLADLEANMRELLEVKYGAVQTSLSNMADRVDIVQHITSELVANFSNMNCACSTEEDEMTTTSPTTVAKGARTLEFCDGNGKCKRKVVEGLASNDDSSDRCFKLSPPLKIWNRDIAEQECVKRGGRLAEVHDQETLVLLTTAGIPFPGAWMGASDKISEGHWVWGSGAEVTVDSWKTGEPDNDGGTEDCMLAAQGDWYDVTCEGYMYYFVCEKTGVDDCATWYFEN